MVLEHLKYVGINMSYRYQKIVLMRTMRKNKQIEPQKHQMKQDISGKIVIHEIKIADIYSLHKPFALPLHPFKEWL